MFSLSMIQHQRRIPSVLSPVMNSSTRCYELDVHKLWAPVWQCFFACFKQANALLSVTIMLEISSLESIIKVPWHIVQDTNR